MQNLEDFYSKFLKTEKSLEFGQGQGILKYTNFDNFVLYRKCLILEWENKNR